MAVPGDHNNLKENEKLNLPHKINPQKLRIDVVITIGVCTVEPRNLY